MTTSLKAGVSVTWSLELGQGVKVSAFLCQKGEQVVGVSHALYTMLEGTLQQPVHKRIKEGGKAEH